MKNSIQIFTRLINFEKMYSDQNTYWKNSENVMESHLAKKELRIFLSKEIIKMHSGSSFRFTFLENFIWSNKVELYIAKTGVGVGFSHGL
jgi:hypothetical protein